LGCDGCLLLQWGCQGATVVEGAARGQWPWSKLLHGATRADALPSVPLSLGWDYAMQGLLLQLSIFLIGSAPPGAPAGWAAGWRRPQGCRWPLPR